MTRALSHRASADALIRFQRQSWTNLVFSLTRRCPLRCAHCITSSAPERALGVVDIDQAKLWAAELPEMAAAGLKSVSFTGGEPIMAFEALAVLTRAARHAGLRTAVVSAGAWGGNPALTARLAERVAPFVDSWDMGYDAFHAEHLSIESFVRAVVAADNWGSRVTVRLCLDEDGETENLAARLESLLPERVPLILQPTYALGRAAETAANGGRVGDVAEIALPCLSTGPFVREDGSAGPCCAALGYGARGRHPFDGSALGTGGLMAAWRRWRADELLRLMRLTGLGLPLSWLKEEGLLPDGWQTAGHVCELCERLWDSEGRAAESLRRMVAQTGVTAKLDQLEMKLYGVIWAEPRTEAETEAVDDRAVDAV